jgi:gluconate kinase
MTVLISRPGPARSDVWHDGRPLTPTERPTLIIWLNGAFGSGKTTLTEELHRRLPEAVVFDPEDVGWVLTQAVSSPSGDYQDLPSWRHLVVEHARTLLKHHAKTLIVPMTLVSRQYHDEIIGALRGAGEQVVHVFLDVPADILESRIRAQVLCPSDQEKDESARQWRLSNIERCVAAAKEQPDDTVMLRSDLMEPSQLADAVLALTR